MPRTSNSPTMQDIAEQLGVSKSAVSLALNNKSGVSDKLRQTILDAATELGYIASERKAPTPDQPLNEQLNIAVVHLIGHEPYTHAHGLSTGWVNGMRAYMAEANATLTLIGGYRSAEINPLAQQLLHDPHNPVDGLILMGPGLRPDEAFVQQSIEKDVPLVIIGRTWPTLPISAISQDYEQQAQLAFDHLLALGHRRIAFVARSYDVEHDWYHKRLRVYQQIMTQHAGGVDKSLIILADDATRAAAQLAKQTNTTAAFVIHDAFAAQLIPALANENIAVPSDLSIIGQDNTEILTTVGFPHFEVGYLAAETLVRQIRNPHLLYTKTKVRSQLVERNTCAPLR